MGNTFEVWAWTEVNPEDYDGASYRWINHYRDEDLDEAIKIMKQLKADGIGCAKLEWR